MKQKRGIGMQTKHYRSSLLRRLMDEYIKHTATD